MLSQTAYLRRSSSLFFIPLVPYPARFARHLPHAGKALSVVILFLHVSCIRFDDARKPASSYRSLPHWGRGTASAVDRVLSQTAYLRRSPSLSFIPLPSIQPPPLRGTSFHRKEGVSTRAPSLGRGCRAQRGGVCFLFRRRSGALVNCRFEMHFLALFHTAIPIQPPPLRGTSFHRKEGVYTRAPSPGRGCRAQRGGVGFLFRRRSRLLFAFPIGEGFAGETVFSFLHPSHAKTTVSYERSFLCVLLA